MSFLYSLELKNLEQSRNQPLHFSDPGDGDPALRYKFLAEHWAGLGRLRTLRSWQGKSQTPLLHDFSDPGDGDPALRYKFLAEHWAGLGRLRTLRSWQGKS
ncbi:hypothetical protein J6590_083602 [Homalodisca vitripennis]|nr:hypothetical protein J6590_083602 [Homalodisca vitripennis]